MFHLGKPILVMSILALSAGVLGSLTLRPSPRATIELWTFTESHWRTFNGINAPDDLALPKRDFETATIPNRTVSIKLVQARALWTRLSMQFMGNLRGEDVPDLVEVEISAVGRFFRPPVSEVGFLPLNDFIEKGGWRDQIVANRLAPWSKDGQVFGIPHDVHPVMIAYNAELFEQAGVDLPASASWADFQNRCLAFQKHWRERGIERRWALELSESNADQLTTMLLQRGINLIDPQQRVCLNDPRVLDTLLTYVRMMSGPTRIGATTAAGNQCFSQDLASGFVGAMVCPDWRLKYLKDYAPTMSGKMKVMALPAWPDSPFRTSTWGGTMMAIPRNARDPQQSWELLERLYLKPDGLRATMRGTYILPPVKSVWNDPVMEEDDAFYSNQKVRRLIRELAESVPPRIVTPASTIAQAELSMVLIAALERHRSYGEDGLEAFCRAKLEEAAIDIESRIVHGRIDDVP